MAAQQNSTGTFLSQTLSACKRAFQFVGFFSLFINLLMLTVPIYMLQLFDRVLASSSMDTLFYLSIIALTALFVLGLLDIARTRITLSLSHWLERKLGPEALLRSPDEVLNGNPLVMQTTKDVETLKNFFSSPALLTLFDAPWVPIYIFAIFLLHPMLGLISIGGAVLLFALAYVNEKATREKMANANMASIKTQMHVSSALRNAETIQAMGMMPAILRHWKKDSAEANTLLRYASQITNTITAFSKSLRLALQIIMLGAGAYLVVQGSVTAGVMIAGAILLSRALAPVEQALSAWRMMLGAREAYYRLHDYFQRPSARQKSMALPTPKGQLKVEKVVYNQPGREKLILEYVDFTLEPGESLAVMGPSTAGKTSLARLIIGAQKPLSGAVRLDGANVYHWDREDFGRHVGYLPQSIELFDGTVKDNIARMSDADPTAIVEAAKLAGVHEMILQMPEGYDTQIRDYAHRLSGGQRQRIGLARALYGKPRLLLLDEPNSNLDESGQKALVACLKAVKQQKTTAVFITHRPELIQCADKILILNEGKMVLFGERDAVLKKIQSPPNPLSNHSPTMTNIG